MLANRFNFVTGVQALSRIAENLKISICERGTLPFVSGAQHRYKIACYSGIKLSSEPYGFYDIEVACVSAYAGILSAYDIIRAMDSLQKRKRGSSEIRTRYFSVMSHTLHY